MPNAVDRSLIEAQVKRWLAHFLRLVLWEPHESMQSFLEVLSPCIATQLEKEIPAALRKNRLEDLDKRAFRWIEKSFWDDIRRHPDDPLDKRTLRLKKLFEEVSRLPDRKGDSEHFPIAVFIEYDFHLKALRPAFKRYPAKISHLPREEARTFVDQTIGGDRGYSRSRILEALNEKRLQRWEAEQLQQANRVIPTQALPKDEEFWFKADEVLKLTPRKAALRIMGEKMGLSEDAVWKVVKIGKKMLPPAILKKMEAAYSAIKNSSSWEFLNQIDPHPLQ